MPSLSSESAFRFGLPPHLEHLNSDPDKWALLKQEMRDWLEPYVGRLTVVMTSRYYGNSKALESGILDAAWVPPLVGFNLQKTLGVDLVARCVRYGLSMNACALMAHVDNFDDRRQSSFWGLSDSVWADASSLTGFLSPLHDLVLAGDVGAAEVVSARLNFAGSQRAALDLVAAGQAKYTGAFVPRNTQIGDEIINNVVVARLCRSAPTESLVQRRGGADLRDALPAFAERSVLRSLLNIDGWTEPTETETSHLEKLNSFAQSMSSGTLPS